MTISAMVNGYDHAFLLDAEGDVSQPAAHLWSADEKLQMTVYTTAPACSSTPGTSSRVRPRVKTESTVPGKAWRWKASSCRTARTMRNGRSPTVFCALAKSMSASRNITLLLNKKLALPPEGFFFRPAC